MGKIEWVCVQCCECSTFQVERKKKSNKFSCKICGKKQSFVKIFATSNQAKDIRKVVQEYNARRFDPQFQQELATSKKDKEKRNVIVKRKENSKWSNFGNFEEEEKPKKNRDFVTQDEATERRRREVGRNGEAKRKKYKKKKNDQKKRKRVIEEFDDDDDNEIYPPMKKRKLDNAYTGKKEVGNRTNSKKKTKVNVTKVSKWGNFM